MTTQVVSTVSDSSFRMDTNLRQGTARFQRRRALSPFVRLAQELGYAKPKTARDNLTKPYQQVAATNRVLRECGMPERVTDLMRIVDASVGPVEAPPLQDALHLAQLADCLEDLSDEAFREKLRRNEATVEDAREFLRRSSEARYRAEQAERAVALWIEEQRRKEAKP